MKEETYLPLQNIKILQICISALGFFLTGFPPRATCILAKSWLWAAAGSWSPAANATLGVGGHSWKPLRLFTDALVRIKKVGSQPNTATSRTQ